MKEKEVVLYILNQIYCDLIEMSDNDDNEDEIIQLYLTQFSKILKNEKLDEEYIREVKQLMIADIIPNKYYNVLEDNELYWICHNLQMFENIT